MRSVLFWVSRSIQSQNSASLMSEAACVPIIIVCLLENNNTRKWNRKEQMWLKDWLEKRSDFSHDNLPRELEMFLPLGCRIYLRMHLSANFLGTILMLLTLCCVLDNRQTWHHANHFSCGFTSSACYVIWRIGYPGRRFLECALCVCVCVRERERDFVMRLYFGEVEHCALCRSFVSFGQWNFHVQT